MSAILLQRLFWGTVACCKANFVFLKKRRRTACICLSLPSDDVQAKIQAYNLVWQIDRRSRNKDRDTVFHLGSLMRSWHQNSVGPMGTHRTHSCPDLTSSADKDLERVHISAFPNQNGWTQAETSLQFLLQRSWSLVVHSCEMCFKTDKCFLNVQFAREKLSQSPSVKLSLWVLNRSKRWLLLYYFAWLRGSRSTLLSV